jgi:hypothetical protein
MSNEQGFQEALRGKKIPILILDQKWHRLFAIHGKPDTIKKLENELNTLLARQGKLNNEQKEMKKLKNQLMDNIVKNMDGTTEESENAIREKKLDEDRRLIDELNAKIEANEDELLEIPNQIKEINGSLMLESMDYFYEKLRVNQKEAKEIEEWITQVRIDLKKNIIRKQNREINNKEIYAYLHDIFGPDVINLFDLQYEEEQNNPEGDQSE